MRLDGRVTDQDGEERDAAVIVELERWEPYGKAGAENFFTTRFRRADREKHVAEAAAFRHLRDED